MVFFGKQHEIVVMDAVHFRRFKRMNDQVTRCSLEKTGDRKKELFIHGDPFGDLFFVFVIKYAGHSLFNEINVIGNAMFAEEEMIFGN